MSCHGIMLFIAHALNIYLTKKEMYKLERGTCIKGLFWPPIEPKSENCFSPISLDWFIRRITEV